ncbi:hypothetical protein CPB83DRAFT_909871 [Crepidotus variabilis]|uniref:DRBM domain-containing protein n=1 Tax=Crepidotus variabilis TaxID=179855 RepID=A0A9P6JKT1_9AGAR|nr:hypothetical protein CPB83DRAFT_909871 [Crepidotus variabilis]
MSDSHPRNTLARACDILYGTTAVVTWEEEQVIGPEHAAIFEWVVKINNTEYGRGLGSTIKKARNEAARVALAKLREEHPDLKF